ncbi:MAG: PAS domain-containing sensor histidine kinase [Hapalosiphonaceae cyanobacterium JJU2]|nr:MAG: PAS domain-containing sensor histidine kinase [Hapalosiphonaceae cyanobacterium JJU2]
MNASEFTQQIKAVRQRADVLKNNAKTSELLPSKILHDSLEELNTALEELRVAEEEIRQQNEELKNTRYALEVERERYKELFDFAPDAYLLTNTEGKILEANRTATSLFKISQKYIKGKLLINFIPENQRRAFRSQLIRLQQFKQIQDWEIHMQTREGNEFHAAISVTMVCDREGNPQGWRWLIRDITARKQAEEQLQAIRNENLQLQETTRLKSQFLAVMSHELRTPMNAILGFSQLLLRHPYNQFPPQARSMVERILSSARRLLVLIEDILDFSKLEAGRLELNLEEFNLAELVTTTVQELHCLAQQKNITINVYINLTDTQIINDSDRVRQILVNLLSNAIKFTDVGNVNVEVLEIQDRVMLIIKDTGIGISEIDLKNIFQEFRQVNQCLTRKHGGTGLGLAIVDQLVRLMKGSITVESKIAEGSTFRVELPRVIQNNHP